MDVEQAVERVLLGETLAGIGAAWREETLRSLGMEPGEARPDTLGNEAVRFVNQVCRRLGERHDTDARAAAALIAWAQRSDQYDAYDSLLSHFGDFQGRDALVRRGRVLFPGPLTAHWDETS